jgi:hypothetical protein
LVPAPTVNLSMSVIGGLTPQGPITKATAARSI